MRGETPWDGNYIVDSVLWVTSHITQFTEPGWKYTKHGYGSGMLDEGSSYISLSDGTDLTIIVEAMSYNASLCHWRQVPPYHVSIQTFNLQVEGSFASITSLHAFITVLPPNPLNERVDFQYMGIIPVKNQEITLTLALDTIMTLSTRNGTKQQYPPPRATPFPFPYADNFDAHPIDSEADYFTDQGGSWQIVQYSSTNRVMRQMVPEPPIAWCPHGESPSAYSIIGNSSWTS